MNSVVRLLGDLRARDEDALAALVVERRVPLRGTGSLIDLAEWLLEPRRVHDDLERLGWRELHRLRSGDPQARLRARRRGFAVLGPHGVEVLPDVSRQVSELLGDDQPHRQDGDGEHEARAGERALALTSLAADVLARLDAAPIPVRTGRSGTRIGGTDIRRIAASLDEPHELVAAVAGWLVGARLVGDADGTWRPTERGRDFLADGTVARWRVLAEQWLDGLGVAEHRELVNGPRGDSEAALVAESVGALTGGEPTALGRAALSDDLDDATERIRAALPDEIEGVYIQPDLTIIAPGPLPADADAGLRAVADLETRGLASTYRLSLASLARGLSSGLDMDEIRERLRSLSLTPLPQPVAYLLDEAARTHGLVRVRRVLEDGVSGTRVSSSDPTLLDRLGVDQDLRPLDLRRGASGTLHSILPVDSVYWALVEARYPVAMEDDAGRERPAVERVTATAPTLPVPTPARELARALLADSARLADDEATTWLQRRLELARRARSSVRVRVSVRGDEPRVLELRPLSVTAHRLRARDEASDVERTLPLDALELLDDAAPGDGDA